MHQLYLSKLQVTNFRNLQSSIISFNSGINCIFGDNGNGKTNLLEAIYYLVQHKSFRKNTSFQQLINVECENPEIILSSVFTNNEEIVSYNGRLNNLKSEWFKNNEPTKKKVELKQIFINPFDSFAFHTTSSFRRNWVDTHLSFISKEYKQILNKYNSALRFRNNLLSKKPNDYRNQIAVIDKQIAEYSCIIIKHKKSFLNELKEYCELTFKIIFDEVHSLELELDSIFLNSTEEEIELHLQSTLEKDLIIGHTRAGVHRDDYIFRFDGYNSFEYCSLGQQKMSFLSLIFAYIELFRYKFKTYPMVLIDDVSGELDGRRWKNLINYLEAKKFQVLITTANDNFKKELEKIEEAKKIFIEDGNIS